MSLLVRIIFLGAFFGLLFSCGDEGMLLDTLNMLNTANSGKIALVKVPHPIARMLGQKQRFTPEYLQHPVYAVGYVEEETLNRLPRTIRDQVSFLNERAWATGDFDREALMPTSDPDPNAMYEGYHNYDQLSKELERLSQKYPDKIRLETAGKSVKGRELWYVVVSDRVHENEHEPKFIFHANMHGDEVVGRELMIYFIRYLMEKYGSDSRITQLVDNSEIFVMPSMNPDGFENASRGNARGRDLNRDLPDRFTLPNDTPEGHEIEVQRIMKLAQDNHFVLGMNWHGGEICFNLPWGNISNANPEDKYWDDAMFYPIGREYTQFNKTMYQNHQDNFDHGLTYGYEWYPVNGGINDWFNYFRRSIHAVVELSTNKWPDSSTLDNYWNDNREAMITYLWRGLRGVHLEIRDEAGALVLKPTIAIASAPKRQMPFDSGYVHRLSSDGLQSVTITAEGFAIKRVEIEASYFSGKYEKVTLKKKL